MLSLRAPLGACLIALFALAGPASACAPGYFDGLAGGRRDVLVVVNANSPASCEVGRYYAARRGIDPAAIAQVYAPTGFFIDWRQYSALREQLLRHLQQMLAARSRQFQPARCTPDAEGRTPLYCEAVLEQLRAGAGINYLVTTLGVPTRVRMDYPGGDFALPDGARPVWYPASVDNLLRLQLLNFHDHAALRRNGVFGSPGHYYPGGRLEAFGRDGRGMREVNALLDRELVVGRIDGLTPGAARRLVDRALAAERAGVAGLYRVDPAADAAPEHAWPQAPDSRARSLFNVFGESRSACLAPGAEPRGDCAAALLHPGWQAAAAGPEALLLFGDRYGSQASLGGFERLLQLRRGGGSCAPGRAPLCDELPPDGREACRAASEDALGEIDTRCAGVAEGFVGTQQVSYPLAYLAAHPTGWGWGGGEWLEEERRMELYGEAWGIAFPALRRGDGHGDAVSLWYGPDAQPARPVGAARCYPGAGRLSGADLAPCGEAQRQRVALAQSEVEPRLRQVGSGRFRLSFWYRLPGERPLQARLRLKLQPAARLDGRAAGPERWLAFRPDGGELQLAPAAGWTRVEVAFGASPAEAGQGWDGRYRRAGIDLSIEGVDGALGLDDFALTDEHGAALLRNGQFDQGHRQVETGDYAVSFLSRLNGAAFFGSVSHYQSGGRSFFSRQPAALGGTEHFQSAMRLFVRGLPLGDAVWLGERNLSGLLYGDPLYSPLAIRLEPPGAAGSTGPQAADPLQLRGELRNGQGGVKQWRVDFCEGTDPWACSRDGRWRPTGVAGRGGVSPAAALGSPWTPPAPGLYSLRLQAECEVAGRRQRFSDFASFAYAPRH